MMIAQRLDLVFASWLRIFTHDPEAERYRSDPAAQRPTLAQHGRST